MKIRGFFASLLLITILPSLLFALPQDDDPAAGIAAKAANAQNEGEFEFAAGKWEELIEKHSDSDLVPEARLNCGICYVQLADFEKSARHLAAAIPLLKDQDVKIPQAKLYLGYSQMQLGGKAQQDGDGDRTNEYYTTATQTFAQLLEEHSDYDECDQASFFQGQAFEQLGRKEEALAAYQKSIGFPKPQFKLDALFYIGDLQDQLGRPGDARETFATYREEVKQAGGHSKLNDANYIDAESAISLAQADEQNGDGTEAKARYQEAAQQLKAFASTVAEDASASVFTVNDAKFRQAFCLNRLKEYESAASLYDSIAASGDSDYTAQSLAFAGSNYLAAGKRESAIAALEKSIQQEGGYAVGSAQLLAGLRLKDGKFQEAYDLAQRFLARAANTNYLVPLKMDQADAAYELPDKREEALALFREIADQHADHPLAPSALYNVAYTSLKLGNPEAAVKAADEYVKTYGPGAGDAPSDPLVLADTLSVKAEALKESQKYAQATQVLEQLINDPNNQQDARIASWKLSSGITHFLAEKYQSAIDVLQPLVDQLKGTEQARASHWLGMSHFRLDAFSKAQQALENALAADAKWSRADEALAFLSRCQLQQQQRTAAAATIQQLVDGFPQSTWVSDALFRLGRFDLDQKQFAQALASLNRVINDYPKSSQLSAALYDAGYCQFELKKFAEADKLFTQLIDEFPEFQNIENAKLQRASVRRMAGNNGASITELKKMLETDLNQADRINAMYELGLAQVNQKDWSAAIATFAALTESAKDDQRLDDFYYELAWANRESNQEAAAIEAFAAIAERMTGSKHYAEANFHLGNHHYRNQEFEPAVKAFAACIKSGDDARLHEKAAYKLAWAHYKQDQFAEANQAFADQVKSFAKGELFADGMFMLAETLFRQKKYREAFEAYVAAQPIVAASNVVDKQLNWLVMLHGSQAANKSKQYEAAIKLAGNIADSEADATFKQDVYLELGTAYSGLKNAEKAMEYWTLAAKSQGKTGARAYCMIGDQYFREKNFSEATDQFKEVFFGFGGKQAADDVRPWQAYALYETARCNYVQIKDAPAEQKLRLVDEAIKYFERLLKDYPGDSLAPEARKQLQVLNKERSKIAGS